MEKYDPQITPDPEEWNFLDESERIEMVKRYHKKAKVKLPNANLHAGIHTIVENQIALGDEIPVGATVERLMGEGLDRHDAIHAVGEALAHHLHAIMSNPETAPTEDAYYRELETQTAEKWRAS
jgi:hypothetical protein